MYKELIDRAISVNKVMKGTDPNYKASILVDSASQFLKAEYKFSTGIVSNTRTQFFTNFAINALTFCGLAKEDSEVKDLAISVAKLLLIVLDAEHVGYTATDILNDLIERRGLAFEEELKKWVGLHEFIFNDTKVEGLADV